MAANYSRSMNADLTEGMTDGRYKKLTQDRGGDVGQATWRDRMHLDDLWYGIHEIARKVLPDGTVKKSPDYIANPMPNKERD